MERRDFIKLGGAAAFLAGYPVHGFTAELPPGRIALVVLEGGLDGLAAVPAVGDPDLLKQRRNLIASNPLALNPFFALHPNLSNFAKMLLGNEAAIVHAAAFPYTSRSHFEGQNIVQSGILTPFASQTGWLGRAMDLAGIAGRALAIDTPLVIRGATSIDSFYPANILGSKNPYASTIKMLISAHEPDIATTLEAMLMKIQAHEQPALLRRPEDLAEAAGRAMREEDGPRIAVVRIPDFDTHANQGTDTGTHPQQMAVIDRVFAGFKSGLGPAWKDSIILTATEFGRTVQENGSAGTDHGYGSVGLLAGGLLKKASVVANWPGLATGDLYEGRDLFATMDYRSVCAACIEAALGLPHDVIAERVFDEPKLRRVHGLLFG
jgi:uncharacterized protein (DUF1501 family)